MNYYILAKLLKRSCASALWDVFLEIMTILKPFMVMVVFGDNLTTGG